MLLLTVDSSRFTGSVGLFDDDRQIMTVTFNVKATFSEKLLYMIDFALGESGYELDDVELIGVNSGPGSFTGLRIGMSVCKGLAYAKEIPVVKVNTLHMLGRNFARSGEIVAPVIDARKNQVFAALLKRDRCMREIVPGGAYELKTFLERCKGAGDVIFLGDGAGKYSDEIRKLMPGAGFSEAGNVTSYPQACAELALERFSSDGPEDLFSLEPDYFRASDAEINYEKNKRTE